MRDPGPETGESARADRMSALLRVVSATDLYLYTNEHLRDGSRRSVFSGPNRERLMGGSPPPGGDVATEWERLIHPEDWHEHLAHRARLGRGEPSEVRYRLVGYDGVVRWIHARTWPNRIDGRVFVDGVVADVTEIVEAEQALREAQEELRRQLAENEYQARHDALTRLGNRRQLFEDLDAATGRAPAEASVLLLFDLDGFKDYNDSFGHPAGDALLARLGERLMVAAARAGGRAYRLGGDEFCVLAPGLDPDPLGPSLIEALSETGQGFEVGSSYGSVRIPDEASTASAAVGLADQRLYLHKRRRRTVGADAAAVLVQTMVERDGDGLTHARRVRELAVATAVEIGLDAETVTRVGDAALFHDIGKIAVPDSVLFKPAGLSDSEWGIIRSHTLVGERILQASPTLAHLAGIVRSSHERVDGTGYPDRLAGAAIPIEARIVFACDAYDALTSDRAYRRALGHDAAIEELERCAGSQFDPAVVAALATVGADRLRSVA
jgi:diguanylate cyclase (GGDEF)-like protein